MNDCQCVKKLCSIDLELLESHMYENTDITSARKPSERFALGASFQGNEFCVFCVCVEPTHYYKRWHSPVQLDAVAHKKRVRKGSEENRDLDALFPKTKTVLPVEWQQKSLFTFSNVNSDCVRRDNQIVASVVWLAISQLNLNPQPNQANWSERKRKSIQFWGRETGDGLLK